MNNFVLVAVVMSFPVALIFDLLACYVGSARNAAAALRACDYFDVEVIYCGYQSFFLCVLNDIKVRTKISLYTVYHS